MSEPLFSTEMARVHVATRAPLQKPGGLHGVVRGLASAQFALGLETRVLHSLPKRGRSGANTWRPEASTMRSPERGLNFKGPAAHFHFAQTAHALRDSGEFKGVPALMHFHGPWFSEGRVQGDGLVRVIAKWATEAATYRKFSAFVTASEAFRRVLSSTFAIDDRTIRTVNPGIDTVRFTPGDAQRAREHLGLTGGMVFGIVRRLEPRMGVDIALRALARVPNVQLWIAGQGSMRGPLENLADELGVKSRVSFLGRIEEDKLPDFYRAVDATIVPTRALEGFGLVVLESLASGTPVIASRLGGLVEAMGPWGEDWCVEPEDVAELADRMVAMAKAPPSRELVVKYAQTKSWENHAILVEAFLVDMFGEG